MRALYDDLCLEGHDEFIKLTTVYPAFFATQKQLKTMLNTASPVMPVYDPAVAGDLIVKGMLRNRREFLVPPEAGLLMFFR